MKKIGMACPHCDARSRVEAQHVKSELTMEIYYCCTNPDCGHRFVASLEIVRTTVLPAQPRAGVMLPLGKHLRRDLLAVMLGNAAAVDHTPLRAAAPTTGDLFAEAPS